MEDKANLDSVLKAVALFTSENTDIANLGLSVNEKLACSGEYTLSQLEKIETVNTCFSAIKRNNYLLSDLAYNPEINCGYYNVRDFLISICEGLNNYLGGVFDASITYMLREDDNVNYTFDGKLVEKSIYDAVYSLLCSVGNSKKEISIYAKDMGNEIKFVVRSAYPVKEPRKNRKEYSVMFSTANDYTDKSYAEIAVQRMNGNYEIVYGKSSTKIEMSIPNNLKIKSYIMQEDEAPIKNGEPVIPYVPCKESALKNMFPVDLIAKLEEML